MKTYQFNEKKTYQFNEKGSEIQALLNQVKNKTLYNNATTEASGLMSAQDKATLDTLNDNVGENIQQINELNDTVSQNSADIDTNAGNIATNASDISALNTVAGGLDTRLSAAENTLANIFQLDANNFMGIYANTQALEEVQMTGAGWALVGEDLTELYAYVWNIPEEEWQKYGETTYDYSDYSGLATQVTQIGSKIGDLTQLETTDKTDLVSAINEVKNNMSTTAEDTTYTDNYGIGADNVQEAIDKVGFVGTDTEIDLTQFTEQRAYITPDGKWITTDNNYKLYGIFIPVAAGTKYRITGNATANTAYAFLKSNKVGSNYAKVTTFATGCSRVAVTAGQSTVDIAPSDAAFMWVFTTVTETGDRMPQKIEVVRESIADYIAKADAEPTKDSAKFVTSGGVYDVVSPMDEALYGRRVYNTYTEGIYIHQGDGTVKTNENWILTDYIPCKAGDTVRVYHASDGVAGISCASFYYANKVWAQSWTTAGYKNERAVVSEVKGIAYVRCGLYLPNIGKCRVYINDVCVWYYTGREVTGLTYDDIKQKIDDVDINNRIYYENMVVQKIIDARVSSETFGQEIVATNSDWGCTPYIDISKANGGIRYNWPRYSTSPNYYGKGGVVFYDAEYTPLTEGVRLIEHRSTAGAEWVNDTVPEGAKYIRISHYTSLEGILYVSLYKLVPDNIFGLDKVLEDIDTTLDNTVYAEELSILRNARTSADTGAMTGSIGLLHFSDIHGDNGAAQAIRAFYDRYSTFITDMVSTGDVPYYYYSDGITFYINNNLTDALLALGNHDGAERTGDNVQGSADWDAVGAQVDYETYYAPYISGWNVTQPTDAATNYLMYYYKDYTSASVRLIVLDVMHQDAEQLQWFTDTLAAARTSGYAVIVASHYIPNTFTEDYIVKRADGDKSSFHYYASTGVTSIDTRFKLDTVYADTVEAFIAAGGEFVIWLCGHYHTDYFTYSNTHPNILFCAINQAGFRRGGFQGYRNVGDHCANFVAVNKAQGLVKIYRIGLKKDKWLRPINVLTYDYVNKKVVSNY